MSTFFRISRPKFMGKKWEKNIANNTLCNLATLFFQKGFYNLLFCPDKSLPMIFSISAHKCTSRKPFKSTNGDFIVESLIFSLKIRKLTKIMTLIKIFTSRTNFSSKAFPYQKHFCGAPTLGFIPRIVFSGWILNRVLLSQ